MNTPVQFTVRGRGDMIAASNLDERHGHEEMQRADIAVFSPGGAYSVLDDERRIGRLARRADDMRISAEARDMDESARTECCLLPFGSGWSFAPISVMPRQVRSTKLAAMEASAARATTT